MERHYKMKKIIIRLFVDFGDLYHITPEEAETLFS